MSHRPRRGRYPKNSHQISNAPVLQQPMPSGGSNYSSHASEVPFYNPHHVAQDSSTLNNPHFHQQTNFQSPTTFQQYPSQQPQQQMNYWQGSTGLNQQDNAWDWSPHSVSEMSHTPQSSTTQPSVQSQPNYQATISQEQPLEGNFQQQIKYSQSMNNIYNSQAYVPEPVPVETVSNYNYPPQNNWQSFNDLTNQNFQQIPLVPQQMKSENIPNVSQAEHVQWNYMPQASMNSQNQLPNSENSTDFSQIPQQNTTNWNEHTTINSWQQTNSFDSTVLNYPETSIGATEHSAFTQYSQNNIQNSLSIENIQYSNYQENNIENVMSVESDNQSNFETKNNLSIEDPEGGTVSNFFHNSIEENNELSNDLLCTRESELTTAHSVTQIDSQMPEGPMNEFVPTLELSPLNKEDIVCSNATVENSFVQKEIDAEQQEIIIGLTITSSEDPPNQEVPEPNDNAECHPLVMQQITDQVIEEPTNQQIPPENINVETCVGRQLTPENEMPENNAVLTPIEGSPIKTPSGSQNLTGSVVQKESSELEIIDKPPSPTKDDIHGVNLETFPDNLERPLDQDKPQQQLRNSRVRRYLQEENTSPLDTSSTSLLDSPDIPCITLAVAAPLLSPTHSLHTTNSTPSSELQEKEESQELLTRQIPEVISNKSPLSVDENLQSSIPQPILLPVNLNPNDSINETIKNKVSNKTETSETIKEKDKQVEMKLDLHNDEFKASSPIKQVKPTSSENDSDNMVGNQKNSKRDHSKLENNKKNEHYYKDYDNHAPKHIDDHNYNRRASMPHNDPEYNKASDDAERYEYNRSSYHSKNRDYDYHKDRDYDRDSVHSENRDYDARHKESRDYDRDYNPRRDHNYERREYEHSPVHSRENRNYDRSSTFRENRDYSHSVPRENRDYDRPSVPRDNRDYDRSSVPRDNRDYDRSSVPRDNRDYDHSSVPRDNRDYDRSSVPRDYNYSPAPHSFDHPVERRDGYYSLERNAERSRQQFADSKYSSYDDRVSYSDREGSRPSSRMSLNETSESKVYRDHDYHKQYASDYERPPSRMSESDMYRSSNNRRPHYYDRPSDQSYYREEEYYRRQKNYEDYDRYAASKNPYYGYYYPYGYNYNYGFYDELYRNDPRYKQQVEEQYREYYRRLGYETDPERLSVHSGCSSSNELGRDMQQRYTDPDVISNGSEYSSYVQQTDIYSEDHQSTPSTRLTPVKFTNPHPLASFSNNGFLVTVLPKTHSTEHSAFVQIHDVQILAQGLSTYEEFKKYDGPLIRGKTHKNDVIDFCLRKIKFYKQKSNVPDRESYILLWELLVLLLRQNGSVVGSDIAELLLKDHEILYPHLSRTAIDTPQGGHSPSDPNEPSVSALAGDTSSPDEGIVLARDKNILNVTQNVDTEKLIRKYREFLLFGHKKEALEFAMKNGLWSHALFLSSKMDLRTYMIVLTRFTNSLALNDPLQSLYQLMSGRQPASITCIADKQWGDWRPHLAMILSNPSPNPENDSKCITTLGDTLASQGCLPAAHFCYLMAQVEFGHFSRKSSKMVLLGADHRNTFNVFASNEAIQCTEIYEYAQSLANPGFMLNHLQGYKFLYATRLMDHGFLPEALQYCEVLSSNFVSQPCSISADLITQVYQFANKLKYHDPCYLTCSDIYTQEDPEWLKIFSTSLQNLQNQVPSEADENLSDETSNIDNSKTENEPTQEYSQPELQSNQNYYDNNHNQQTYYNQENQNFYSNNNVWNTENNQFQNNQLNAYENQANQSNFNQYGGGAQTIQQWNLPSPTIADVSLENKTIDPVPDIPVPSATISPHSPQNFSNSKFDFQGLGNHQVFNRERTTSTSSIGYQKDRHDSNVSSGSDYGMGTTGLKKKPSEDRKVEKKEDKSRQQVGRSWLGGIFSRLLPKAPNQMILPDDKNPTIIWDPVKKDWINTDSNETDENSQPVAPPTDTELLRKSSFSEMPTPTAMPSTVPAIATTNSTGVNKFQRPKIRGMRGNYVDVMNPSNTVTNSNNVLPDALFPSPMPLSQGAPQLFVPAGPVDDTPMDFVSSGQPYLSSTQDDDNDASDILMAPPMFDPAEFNSRRSGFNSAKHSVGPARRTYPT